MHDDDDNDGRADRDAGSAAQTDMVLLLPPQVGQAGNPAIPVLRRRGDTVEAGVIRELEDGKPIHGQVVRLGRRSEHPLLFDVETVTEVPVSSGVRSGPPQVATESYRAHWDAIFGQAGSKTDALN